MKKYPDYAVSTVVDTGHDKSRWTRIGAAFVNKDESITVLLDAVPVNGKLILQPVSEEENQTG